METDEYWPKVLGTGNIQDVVSMNGIISVISSDVVEGVTTSFFKKTASASGTRHSSYTELQHSS